MLIQSPTPKAESIITALEEQSQPIFKWLHSLKVTSPTQQKEAEDLLISARYAWKQADTKRKELTHPLDEAKKRIIQLFQPYMNRLETGVTILNRELTTYHEALVALAREREIKALEDQAARMREAAQTGELLEPVDAPGVPSAPKTSRANLGTVTYRKDLDVQVIQPALVPRDLCEPSLSLIRARVRSGVTDIPGVLITRKVVSSTRVEGGTR